MADSKFPTTPIHGLIGEEGAAGTVTSAIFADPQSAQAAIQELRDVGVPAANISVISRDEDQSSAVGEPGAAGVAHETIGDEGLAYRASSELPNYEDLPTTEAYMTGQPLPAPNGDVEASGEAGERLGLSGDSDLVRRNEAQTNATLDIYTDFPDQPGGVNPDSPVADEQASTVQESTEGRTGAPGTAAIGAGIGGVAGLVLGLGALAIPGVGPFLAAGPLAAALGGALAGSATGGIIGGLSSIGVPEEYARTYASRIEQGETLVSVRADALSRDMLERVLTANGGQEVH